MGFRCGIVGLPNVGKSTLFNALTRSAAAQAANYPFCTIDPNIGEVAVRDPRLDALCAVSRSRQILPARLGFVDIAGLVKGASGGEGLGNRFLANVRDVDAIAHVVRCFEEADIAHVRGKVEPLADIEVVETELMLADLDSLARRREGLLRKARGGDAIARAQIACVDRVSTALDAGEPARRVPRTAEEAGPFRMLQLLTDKPMLYIANVDEARLGEGGGSLAAAVRDHAKASQAGCVVISAAIEAEIALLDDAERAAFLEALGLTESGLDRVIRAGYDLLDLITFFTSGPKETRAWTVPRGVCAPEAAARIHSDFARGFIRAECVSSGDFIRLGGEQGAREGGVMRSEGRDYRIRDGDVVHFRFNV